MISFPANRLSTVQVRTYDPYAPNCSAPQSTVNPPMDVTIHSIDDNSVRLEDHTTLQSLCAANRGKNCAS